MRCRRLLPVCVPRTDPRLPCAGLQLDHVFAVVTLHGLTTFALFGYVCRLRLRYGYALRTTTFRLRVRCYTVTVGHRVLRDVTVCVRCTVPRVRYGRAFVDCPTFTFCAFHTRVVDTATRLCGLRWLPVPVAVGYSVWLFPFHLHCGYVPFALIPLTTVAHLVMQLDLRVAGYTPHVVVTLG